MTARFSSTAMNRIAFVYHNIGAPTRYRVFHQIEQAQLAGLAAGTIELPSALGPACLDGCGLLYLHRVALGPRSLALVLAARRRGLPVVFDSDDLVWDLRDRQYSFLDAHFRRDRILRHMLFIRRTRAMMHLAAALVFSTNYLAALATQAFVQPAFVNPNALSQAMIANAAAVLEEPLSHSRENVVIGYFSGTPHVHDEDLASIGPALAAVLSARPHVALRIYGEVGLPDALTNPQYAQQIEHRAAVPWDQLPDQIAQVDINIAPLIDNPQRRSKSAVKVLEAALLAVPTVATRLEPYCDTIADAVTGRLAADRAQWQSALLQLIDSAAERWRMGAAARIYALEQHSTAARAPHFAAVLERIQRYGP
jgi:glycosyltransferase involved in cell wall biosynthesis